MKLLNKPSIDSYKLYNDIVSNKQKKNKVILEKCRDDVFCQYSFFLDNTDNLEKIIPSDSSLIQSSRNELINCYSSSVHLNAAKGKLISGISKCPYCEINEPNTFEHYFSKEKYPEFSVFISNLIPCCSHCNEKKGTKLLDEFGNRKFLHFYYDSIPNEKFLFCRLTYFEKNRISTNFYLDEDVINKYVVINNHFENLNLIKRYESVSENIISTIVADLKKSKNNYKINKENSYIQLKIRYESLVDNYGYNHMETCIYEGFINSENFYDVLWDEL